MKVIKLPCYVNGQIKQIGFYIGNPKMGSNPLQSQIDFLSKRGVTLSDEIIAAISDISKTAQSNGTRFDEIFQYMLETQNFTNQNNK